MNEVLAMSDRPCGIIATDMTCLRDTTGCILANNHDGRHRFVGSNGRTYEWETDMDCECDNSCDGDWCFTYWETKS